MSAFITLFDVANTALAGIAALFAYLSWKIMLDQRKKQIAIKPIKHPVDEISVRLLNIASPVDEVGIESGGCFSRKRHAIISNYSIEPDKWTSIPVEKNLAKEIDRMSKYKGGKVYVKTEGKIYRQTMHWD